MMKKNCTNPLSVVSNQAGQAIVEYILVLVVTVSIVLGFVYQLNDAFRVWANNYFGEYLTCLLETGELPTLGSQEKGLCAQSFQAFTLSEGRPLVGDGVGEGGSGRSEGSSSSDNSGKAKSSRGNGGGARVGVGGTSGSRRFRRRSNRKRYIRSGGGPAEGENSSESSSKYGDGGIQAISQRQRGKATRIRYRSYASIAGGGKRKKDEKEKSKKVKVSIPEKERVNRRKLLKVSKQPPKVQVEDETGELGLGGFMRYLIIAAIVIALLVLLGGQALQISKSMD